MSEYTKPQIYFFVMLCALLYEDLRWKISVFFLVLFQVYYFLLHHWILLTIPSLDILSNPFWWFCWFSWKWKGVDSGPCGLLLPEYVLQKGSTPQYWSIGPLVHQASDGVSHPPYIFPRPHQFSRTWGQSLLINLAIYSFNKCSLRKFYT